jgi:hypothetical protein
MLQTVDMVIREVHEGLWFLVVGYYFLLFVFLMRRWRKSGSPFQLAMALFFLLLAIGRVFYFVGDFYADSASLAGLTPPYNVPFLGVSPFWLMSGAFFQWMALALLSATAGFMIFGKRWAEIGFAVPAVAIGFALGFIPFDDFTRQVLTAVFGGVYALFIPGLFWYLAWQSGGILRRSNLMFGFGFFILFAGRAVHAARFILATYVFGSVTIPGVLAPGLIVIGLILIAAGIEWEQTS